MTSCGICWSKMFFVAIGFSDSKVSRLFDLARLVLEPDFARRAHITLRGPYSKKGDISSSVLGRDVGKIRLNRPGTFFDGAQNTVFLGVEIFGISDFWRKPDFPNGTPHLSIYDGSNRRFAWNVMNVLRRSDWKMELNSTPMAILEKKRKVETEFILHYDALSQTLESVVGEVYSAEFIKEMKDVDRILLFAKFCQKIQFLTRPSSRLI